MVTLGRRLGALALTALAGTASCAHATRGVTGPLPAGGEQWVDSALAAMTPRDRAAQLVWPQIYGDYTPASSAAWRRIDHFVHDEHVGGIIVSIGSPIEMADKLNALQRRAPLPLLIGSDLEAGAGFRARGGYFLPNGIYLGGATIFPPQMALGATRDTTLAYAMGEITALEGRALGVHMAFAPVLDVNNNPANPVIGTRSFGENPQLVAAMGRNVVRGIQEHGELATGKHFPGHGDTDQNSHLTLPTITASRQRLDTMELVPFRAAIDAGVEGIMTFHGRIPALDTTPVPATLSPTIMTGLLRHELRFGGLLVTDAMDMNGVLANLHVAAGAPTVEGNYGAAVSSVGIAEACKLAIGAGADVLLMPSDIPASIDAVVAGVKEGRFTQARVDSSVRRILEMKYRLHLQQRRVVDLDSVRAIVGDSAHLAVAERVAERSITLAKDSLQLVPLRPSVALPATPLSGAAASGAASTAAVMVPGSALPTPSPAARVLSITIASRADLEAGGTFNAELRKTLGPVREVYLTPETLAPVAPSVVASADSVDAIVLGSYLSGGTSVSSLAAPPAMIDLVRQLQSHNRRLIVVAFGNPYLLQAIPDVPTYMVAWGGFPVSQRAAARAVTGRAAISGLLPISIPPLLGYGAGERREMTVAPVPASTRQ